MATALSGDDPAEMRAGLNMLPSWVLERKAAANRQVIAVMRTPLAAGEQAVPDVRGAGLAWLERQPRLLSASSLSGGATPTDVPSRGGNGGWRAYSLEQELGWQDRQPGGHERPSRCDSEACSRGAVPGHPGLLGDPATLSAA
jgi:hypothetical protein